MSQFLVYSSRYDLSAFAQRITPTSSFAGSVIDCVANRYFESFEDLWLVNTMDEWMLDLRGNIDKIMNIAARSDALIFWYIDMYEELDEVNSLTDLRNAIIAVADDPDPELYLHVVLH